MRTVEVSDPRLVETCEKEGEGRCNTLRRVEEIGQGKAPRRPDQSPSDPMQLSPSLADEEMQSRLRRSAPGAIGSCARDSSPGEVCVEATVACSDLAEGAGLFSSQASIQLLHLTDLDAVIFTVADAGGGKAPALLPLLGDAILDGSEGDRPVYCRVRGSFIGFNAAQHCKFGNLVGTLITGDVFVAREPSDGGVG